MIRWEERTREEKALLNPGFCSMLLWHAADGFMAAAGRNMSLEECFLILPLVLHRTTRESLPRSIRTSMAVWLDENPLARTHIVSRAQKLVPYTREALLFGGLHGFLQCNPSSVLADLDWAHSVRLSLAQSSDEVRNCARKSIFVGKWLASTGDPSTVLALLGVCP